MEACAPIEGVSRNHPLSRKRVINYWSLCGGKRGGSSTRDGTTRKKKGDEISLDWADFLNLHFCLGKKHPASGVFISKRFLQSRGK